jgi:NAD(P)-dependent dehydrogenase (short-subunit alcohol dehydrogenase family)
MNVLVIGASRGIGLEFVRQYRADGAAVRASARDDAGLALLRELGAAPIRLDVADAASVAKLPQQLDGARFDVVIVNAGVYGPRTLDAPQPPAEADFDAVMRTNVLGPMRIVAQVTDALAPQARLAVISSRMGSIGLRTASGGWLYRASKAAVNSVLKDASIALNGRAICVALHPGWVRTDMGGAGADLSVEQSVADMRATLAALTAQHNGSFLNHDGRPIDW